MLPRQRQQRCRVRAASTRACRHWPPTRRPCRHPRGSLSPPAQWATHACCLGRHRTPLGHAVSPPRPRPRDSPRWTFPRGSLPFVDRGRGSRDRALGEHISRHRPARPPARPQWELRRPALAQGLPAPDSPPHLRGSLRRPLAQGLPDSVRVPFGQELGFDQPPLPGACPPVPPLPGARPPVALTAGSLTDGRPVRFGPAPLTGSHGCATTTDRLTAILAMCVHRTAADVPSTDVAAPRRHPLMIATALRASAQQGEAGCRVRAQVVRMAREEYATSAVTPAGRRLRPGRWTPRRPVLAVRSRRLRRSRPAREGWPYAALAQCGDASR